MAEALRRAMALLARREHSRRELAGKLRAKLGAAQQGEIEEALDRLEQDGHLSDKRFAEGFVNYRGDAWGDRKIAYELRQRGVDEGIVGMVMSETLAEEKERALAVLEKKNPGPLPKERKGRDRLRRFLEQRGFAASSIRHALKARDASDDDGPL